MVRIVSGEFIQGSKLQQINSSLGEMVAQTRLLPQNAQTAIKTKQSQYAKHG